jgi:hypothetical protein
MTELPRIGTDITNRSGEIWRCMGTIDDAGATRGLLLERRGLCTHIQLQEITPRDYELHWTPVNEGDPT